MKALILGALLLVPALILFGLGVRYTLELDRILKPHGKKRTIAIDILGPLAPMVPGLIPPEAKAAHRKLYGLMAAFILHMVFCCVLIIAVHALSGPIIE